LSKLRPEQCPECGSVNSKVLDFGLGERIYKFKCRNCGCRWEEKLTEVQDLNFKATLVMKVMERIGLLWRRRKKEAKA